LLSLAADLAQDTAVRADLTTPGRYHVMLPSYWDDLLPSGGVAMTAALRAAEAHVAEPPLRLGSATTTRAGADIITGDIKRLVGFYA
jgi:hypothetical protein